MSGPLAPALGFAAIAFVAHATGLTLLLLLVAWRHAAETAALFGSDHPVASFVPRAVADGIVASWITGPSAVVVSLLAFYALCKLHRIHASVADVGRAHLFACAALVPATVPFVGLLALFAFPRFLHDWLCVHAALSPVQRGLIAVMPFITGWVVAGLLLDAVLDALGSAPEGAVMALVAWLRAM